MQFPAIAMSVVCALLACACAADDSVAAGPRVGRVDASEGQGGADTGPQNEASETNQDGMARSFSDASLDIADAGALDGQRAWPTETGTADAGESHVDASAEAGAPLPYKGVALYEVNTCADIAALNLSWYYNWTTKTGCKANVEFVPHIWGHPSEPIATEVAQAAAAGHQTMLGFNEPDNAMQSNMTVSQAIALWPLLVHAGVRLGSPATQANTAGQQWFKDFMAAVGQQNLRVDFLALHWYGWDAGSCKDASALEAYIAWAEQWKRPIWITEWACLNVSAPTPQTVKTFYDDAVAMFQRHPSIERYAWYLSRSTDNNALIQSASMMPSPFGADYAGAPSTH